MNIFIILFIIFIFLGVISIKQWSLIGSRRDSIFIGAYSIFLMLPYLLVFSKRDEMQNLFGEVWWSVPLSVSTLFATFGPFIYLYISRKAEEKLLKEQKGYQETLRYAAAGMGDIKDLGRLLKLIVYIVARKVRVNNCKIYLFHDESQKFVLKSTRSKRYVNKQSNSIDLNSTISKYLQDRLAPLKLEVAKSVSKNKRGKYKNLYKEMLKFNANLIIPSFVDDRLIAIFILGEKKTGIAYSEEDLAIFTILASQSALAIENAQFFEDMKKTQEHIFKAEKMATIGTMADGLSHQINNRLHSMGFIAGDALDTIKLNKGKDFAPKIKKLMNEAEFALERIEVNVKRGGEIVEGLLKYTRKGSQAFEPVDFKQILDAALEMLQFKINLQEISIKRRIPSKLSYIEGNFTQIQEVLFNIIDNSYDAMMQRKNEGDAKDYIPKLDIKVLEQNGKIIVETSDNGIGVKAENFSKLFTPFFTTKSTANKGTGLGLYVIRQIIEENHGGKVIFTSEHMKGSQTTLVLPKFIEKGKDSS